MPYIKTRDLKDGAVTGSKLGGGAVSSASLGANSVTLAKVARQTDATFIMGKGAGADCVAQALSGDVTVSSTGIAAIGTNKIGSAMIGLGVAAGAPGAITASNVFSPIVLVFDVPDAASGNADYTALPFKIRVDEIGILATGGAGDVGNTVIVHNGITGNAISDVIVRGATDKVQTWASTLDDAFTDIASAATIRFTTVRVAGSNAFRCTIRGSKIA